MSNFTEEQDSIYAEDSVPHDTLVEETAEHNTFDIKKLPPIELLSSFTNGIKDIASTHSKTINKAIDSNDKSTQSLFDSYDDQISFCQKQIESETSTSEDKRFWQEQIEKSLNAKNKKDSEGKAYNILTSALQTASVPLSFVTGALLIFAARGGKIDLASLAKHISKSK